MRVVHDEAYQAFLTATDHGTWKGARIKEERFRILTPGGRVRVTLFEQVEGTGRPHPRFQVEFAPVVDPAPPSDLFLPPDEPPRSAAALEALIQVALEAVQGLLEPDPATLAQAPRGSERRFALALRAQRTSTFFKAVRSAVDGWLASGALPAAERAAARYGLRTQEDLARAGEHVFDDADTGTYHSYRHDAPFVHYLEKLIATLPGDETAAFALLGPDHQESIRRQRDQALRHLDHLMRHKYAYDGIRETDIERSLGGLLIDRATRHIASESLETRTTLVPRYELLRIDPSAGHPQRGQWVYRDGSTIKLEDGTPVTVTAAQLRVTPVDESQLTFRRAIGDRRLRANTRFPWEGRGYVQPGEVAWISWAGHCDIKAVMEELGIALLGQLPLVEHRSESGVDQTYDRELLLEMVASVLEFGSLYVRADGSGDLRRGITSFGGARNDGRPDRLTLSTTTRSFQWPRPGARAETFTVESIDWGEGAQRGDGLFLRYTPDLAKVDFAPNPRYLATVEGDYNQIDLSGALIVATLQVDSIDPASGYPTRTQETTRIDLRPQPKERRSLLGTELEDAARRRVRRYTLDRDRNEVIGELTVWESVDGKWRPRLLAEETVRVALAKPLRGQLGREMRGEDPELFQTLLGTALRDAENICADTDAKAEVWNGVITRIDVARRAENRAARVEHWSLDITARFGAAVLEYLVRRDDVGEPRQYCPVPRDEPGPPDFLWQDLPDIGSKGFQDGDWIMNRAMVERGVVGTRPQPQADGGVYVYDDHVKNVFELIFCALAGYGFTIVHQNKRYGFKDAASFRAAKDDLARLRAAVKLTP